MSDHDERWVLDHLVGLCRDEEQTLRFAAEHVANQKVRALLGELADERARFANELLPHARRLGGGSAEIAEGTWKGAFHHRWLRMKDGLVGHSDGAMVQEAERSEQATVASFEEALGGMLPPTVRDLIESQYDLARAGRDRLRTLGSAH
jgi:uncharacterized protein (TIGR02284 family)